MRIEDAERECSLMTAEGEATDCTSLSYSPYLLQDSFVSYLSITSLSLLSHSSLISLCFSLHLPNSIVVNTCETISSCMVRPMEDELGLLFAA